MAHEDSSIEKHSPGELSVEQDAHADIEPLTVRREDLRERIAIEMKRDGIDIETLPLGSSDIESEPAYSQMFGFGPHVVTNQGIIRVKGRKFDFVQILQRS